jgi:tripartite-type tricarboxylate transporter receptor subunit TctC
MKNNTSPIERNVFLEWMRADVLVSIVVLLLCCATGAHAQGYPSKPIRIIVPASPGSGLDAFSRTLGREVGSRMGQALVIEDMTGAGGNIASAYVARTAPDGYTLLMQITTFVVNPHLYKNAAYDPVKDFQPVILAAWGGRGMLVVNATLQEVNTVKDLVAYAKARPGQLNYASPGYGTPQHFQMEIFKRMTGADFTHVPFKTPADTVNALLSGNVTATFVAASVALPQLRAGKLKILASNGARRWVHAPEVPTMMESGFPDFKFDVWYGFLAPVGTPTPIVRRLNAEFAAVLNLAAVRETLSGLALDATSSTPDEFAAQIKADLTYWAKVIKETGIIIE